MSIYTGYALTDLDNLPTGGVPGDALIINAGGQPEWSPGAVGGGGRSRITAPLVSMADPRGIVDDWSYDAAVDEDYYYLKTSVAPHTWIVAAVGTVAP